MRKTALFDFSTLSRTETVVVVVATAAFLAFQTLVVGLIPAQVLMVVLFLLLFFAHPWSRRLAVALLPFVVFEVSYDWMRLYPNYMVNAIDVRGIYDAEKALFGITAADGSVITLCEHFNIHHTAVADALCGLAYLCWVPGPMALGLWLYFSGHRREYLHFAVAFIVVNWVGFAIYYLHPAAPPWYVLTHGFDPVVGTPGSAAGLVRFDQLVGYPVFASIYVNNSNIFAAVPSLHSAYMLVATIYAVRSRCPRLLTAVCVVVTMGIWIAAVYTCHHYVIDVLLGIATAFAGVWLFEALLVRWKPVAAFMRTYEQYVSPPIENSPSKL
jgi:hypothetical protein